MPRYRLKPTEAHVITCIRKVKRHIKNPTIPYTLKHRSFFPRRTEESGLGSSTISETKEQKRSKVIE